MSTGAGSRSRIWSTRFSVLFGINFVITFAQFMTVALLPKTAESLGASAVIVGVVTGVFAVTSIAVRPAVGWATLTMRHSTLLASTVLVILVAFVLYALSTSIPILIVARLIHGAAMGFLAPVTLAMAGDALPPSRMAQGIGIFSLGQAVSTAAGPSAGIGLVSTIGYPKTFLSAAALLLVAAVAATLVRSPRLRRTGTRAGWRNFVAVEALVPAAVMLCLGGAFSGVNAFIVLYGESRGVDQIGLFFAAYAAFILISRPITGKIADRYGVAVVIIPGMVMFAASFVIISQVSTLPGFLIAGAVSALGYGICQPAVQTLALMSVEPRRRGVASNTNYLGLDLGYLIVPVIAGGIVTAAGRSGASSAASYSAMFLALTVPIGLGLIIFVVSRPWNRGRRPAITSSES